LRWHYRSKHERLIAFSNHQYYDDDLVVFPSPARESANLGIRWHYLADAVYGSSKNQREAEVIARAVAEHMRTHPEESLGVVAMNQQQQHLIERLVESEIKADAAARNGMERAESSLEEFFVKNLESVQGDERDVIFISMTYGPRIAGGRPEQHFGPISNPGGERRLNVLFTRAKSRVEVFSSMRSHDVVPAGTSGQGPKDLRDYLKYAETGAIESRRVTDRDPDSEFEVAVARELRSLGYPTMAQVGVAGFFIDIGVENPERPGEFLLGIECDGASYHSGRSVRDRDRLRQRVLEKLNWRIHRIWSTDWFSQPAHEIQKVAGILAECRQRSHVEPAPPLPTAPATGQTDAVAAVGKPLPAASPAKPSAVGPSVLASVPMAKPLAAARASAVGPGTVLSPLDHAWISLGEIYSRQARFIWPDLPRDAWFLSRPEIATAILAAQPRNRREYEEHVPASLRSAIPQVHFAAVEPEIYRITRFLRSQQVASASGSALATDSNVTTDNSIP
jgi:very-short-patch-repair endonuclease